jgi:hypothetical protein
MVKALADGNIKLILLFGDAVQNWRQPTVAELSAGHDISMSIQYEDYKFTPTASETISDRPLGAKSNSSVPGIGNFDASITPYRHFDKQGKASLTEDVTYQGLRVKGTSCYLYERQSPKSWEEPIEAGDVVTAVHALSDNPQKPSNLGGYQKAVIPLLVQDFELDVEVGV